MTPGELGLLLAAGAQGVIALALVIIVICFIVYLRRRVAKD